MNVLVNATSARIGGGVTTLRNLLRAFVDVDGEKHRYTIVARSELCDALDPKHSRVELVTSNGVHSLARRVLWEQLGVALRAATSRADVLLSPANLAVLAAPVPQVMMFRNLAPFDPLVLANATPRERFRLETLRALGFASARVARKVVFVSEYARSAILPYLRIARETTTCIPLGRATRFSPEARSEAPALLAQLGVDGRYVLAVGDFYPYKNFVELVDGFGRVVGALPPDVRLVIAGTEVDADYASAVRGAIEREGLRGRVVLAGPVPYGDLPGLYASASLFVFPSTCENFPNVLVEAMASGAPTLCSNLGPMPEIGGEGVAYFDPFSPDDLASGIRRL
ncbi:MAG: glycosyltransferase family 4 protein, partial [Actinobacteria bacterium]|nr:glycosyltransferase family 4 protein [Actinomycetota bacterium]